MSLERVSKSALNRLFWALSSLKLAVLVIFSLAVSLAAGTILESLYDTPTSQYWIYRSAWFHAILGLLGVNIFCVAMSRYPWKTRHLPFLLAHLGILILLAGSLITELTGVDGNLRMSEGETASVVELDTASLILSEKDQVKAIPIPWIPFGVKFKPVDVSAYGIPYDLKVDQFLSHADSVVSFVTNSVPAGENETPTSALRLQMVGGPMGISEDIWLWEGAMGWKIVQAGPAQLALGTDIPSRGQVVKGQLGQPQLTFKPQKDGSILYFAQSSSGKRTQGRLGKGHIVGEVIQPGWRGGVHLTVLDWIPRAVSLTTYRAARVQYGSQAPTSAIHVVVGGSGDAWLGLGDRAVLHVNDREVEIGYFPKRFILPFSLRLEKFTIDHDQGTMSPASYASRVSVLSGKGQKDVNISMNEPLQNGGYTIYQASYEEADPRPVTSIFAVNQDPGRIWKYTGSLFIVLGAIWLFASKYRNKKTGPVLGGSG